MPLMAAFDELALVGLLDVVRPHPLENVAEQVELAIGVAGRGGARARSHQQPGRLDGHEGQCGAGDRAQEDQRSLAHHPRTFWLLLVAHQGAGSMGAPSFRNSI